METPLLDGTTRKDLGYQILVTYRKEGVRKMALIDCTRLN